MYDSHDIDWLFDEDSEYNRQRKLKLNKSIDEDIPFWTDEEIREYWEGEGQYQLSQSDEKVWK
jgi:hypothetical protein